LPVTYVDRRQLIPIEFVCVTATVDINPLLSFQLTNSEFRVRPRPCHAIIIIVITAIPLTKSDQWLTKKELIKPREAKEAQYGEKSRALTFH